MGPWSSPGGQSGHTPAPRPGWGRRPGGVRQVHHCHGDPASLRAVTALRRADAGRDAASGAAAIQVTGSVSSLPGSESAGHLRTATVDGAHHARRVQVPGAGPGPPAAAGTAQRALTRDCRRRRRGGKPDPVSTVRSCMQRERTLLDDIRLRAHARHKLRCKLCRASFGVYRRHDRSRRPMPDTNSLNGNESLWPSSGRSVMAPLCSDAGQGRSTGCDWPRCDSSTSRTRIRFVLHVAYLAAHRLTREYRDIRGTLKFVGTCLTGE